MLTPPPESTGTAQRVHHRRGILAVLVLLRSESFFQSDRSFTLTGIRTCSGYLQRFHPRGVWGASTSVGSLRTCPDTTPRDYDGRGVSWIAADTGASNELPG